MLILQFNVLKIAEYRSKRHTEALVSYNLMAPGALGAGSVG